MLPDALDGRAIGCHDPRASRAVELRAAQRGEIPREAAKSVVLPEMLATGRPWAEIVKEKGLTAASADSLGDVVAKVLAANPDIVAKYKEGKLGVIGVLVGAAMKETRGTADAKTVKEMLEAALR